MHFFILSDNFHCWSVKCLKQVQRKQGVNSIYQMKISYMGTELELQNTDISSAFRKQWFADLQYQYSLFKAEAGQTR